MVAYMGDVDIGVTVASLVMITLSDDYLFSLPSMYKFVVLRSP